MPRAVTGWFCKNEVSAVLLFCFSPARYKVQPVAQRFCNSFSIFCCPGCGAGLLPPADRAAAESDVAGLGSEATATFGVEWLQPLLQQALALAALAADAAAGALEQARPPTPAQPNSPLPACLHRAPGFQSVGRVGCPGGPQTTPSRGGKGDLVCHAWPMVSSEAPALTRERPQWRCW